MASTADRTFIDPHRLYALRGFQQAGGISETRRRLAKQHGVTLPILKVGRRAFVRGSDGIAYIEKLAELAARDAVDLGVSVGQSSTMKAGTVAHPKSGRTVCGHPERGSE